MTIHNSAGVYVDELDNSLNAVGPPTSIGAIVGESKQGTVGVPTEVLSADDFLAQFGEPDPAVSYLHYSALAFLAESNQLWVTRVAPGSLYSGVTVGFASGMNNATLWTYGEASPDLYAFGPTDLFIITGANQGVWANYITVDIYPNTQANDNTFYIDVYRAGTAQPVESHLVSLNLQLNGFGTQINVAEYVNNRSSLIAIVQNDLNADYVLQPTNTFVNTLTVSALAGGYDGTPATTGDIVMGWDGYADPEQLSVNILINGGYTNPSVQQAIAQLAESRMDCIAILDTPSDQQSVPNAIAYRRNVLLLDTSYATLYSPDYLILDTYSSRKLYVPPSGFVAAAYARTDNDFATWFAVAGTNRGRLDVLGVRVVYNQDDRDAFSDNNINPTRVIPSIGICIWGADTLQVEASALSNVNVRRLMIFIEQALDTASMYSVFDPNDPILWAKLVDICDRFLLPIKNGRGVYDYEVVCDASNNIPATIANGDVRLDLYIDPTIPAKRIHLIAVVNKTGATITAGV